MLNVLCWIHVPPYRPFRLHPHKHTMWEYNDPVWEATGEVGQEFDALTSPLLHLLAEMGLNL